LSYTSFEKGDFLRGLTVVALQTLSGYGMYHILTNDLSEEILCDAFAFVYSLLDDDHRGIRYMVVETCIALVSRLEGLELKKTFQGFVKNELGMLLVRLEKEYHSLYRKVRHPTSSTVE